jgi:hypothetical protein
VELGNRELEFEYLEKLQSRSRYDRSKNERKRRRQRYMERRVIPNHQQKGDTRLLFLAKPVVQTTTFRQDLSFLDLHNMHQIEILFTANNSEFVPAKDFQSASASGRPLCDILRWLINLWSDVGLMYDSKAISSNGLPQNACYLLTSPGVQWRGWKEGLEGGGSDECWYGAV